MEAINQYMPLSPDLNRERLDTLKRLMPDLFTAEGRLNPDELRRLVEADRADGPGLNDTERYEFRWYGKAQAKRNAFTPARTTLVYDEARSVKPAQTENLIIEGENLEVLKLLLAPYREQVKCIYIDPPYNTGKDFVYSDNYTEDKRPYWENTGVTENGVKVDTNTDSSGRFHSDWLNMMYSRLLVARDLLTPNGVIFMSIDDNEVHHLRKLADEVFGEDNFVSEFIWEKKKKPSFLHKNVGKLTEYIISYVKDSNNTFPFSVETTEEGKKTPINNAGNSLGTLVFPPNSVYFGISDQTVEVQDMSEGNIITSLLRNVTIVDGKNENELVLEGEWRYSQDTINEIIEDGDEIRISKLPFRPNHIKNGGEVKKMKNAFSPHHYQMKTNEDASDYLINLFEGKDIFDNPKPFQLIQLLIKGVTYDDKNALILDFFGGSGTTAQAVMELNRVYGGNRKFILVQMPELTDVNSEAYKAGYKRISDITIERCKRVVEKLAKPQAQPAADESQTAIAFDKPVTDDAGSQAPVAPVSAGFRVFKLQKSNFPRTEWAPNPDLSEDENIAGFRKYIAEKEAQLVTAFNRPDLLTEILLKRGYPLTYTTETVDIGTQNELIRASSGSSHSSNKTTLICLDAPILPETVEYFKMHTTDRFICLERALDTTAKWNLKHYLGDNFFAF